MIPFHSAANSIEFVVFDNASVAGRCGHSPSYLFPTLFGISPFANWRSKLIAVSLAKRVTTSCSGEFVIVQRTDFLILQSVHDLKSPFRVRSIPQHCETFSVASPCCCDLQHIENLNFAVRGKKAK
jgi:hypothetical protein